VPPLAALDWHLFKSLQYTKKYDFPSILALYFARGVAEPCCGQALACNFT